MENKFIYLTFCFFLLSLILYFVQGIINFKFYNIDNDENITEKTLYEQFSYEVYSSISTVLPTNYILSKDTCPDGYEPFQFNLDLDSYFDCRGKYSKDLNSRCHNKIIDNLTSCFIDNSWDINYGNIKTITSIDDRNKYCEYFSRFTQKISLIKNQSICIDPNGKTYNELLSVSVYMNDLYNYKNRCPTGYKICGILDTRNNLLCLREEENCPLTSIYIDENKTLNLINDTSLRVLVSVDISENQPINHLWDTLIRETYEKIDEDSLNKRRNIAKSDFRKIDTGRDHTYELVYGDNKNNNLFVQDITDFNPIKGYYINKYNLEQNLNIYGRSYIGFKDTDELKKFQDKFNPDDHRDNPLYKISSTGHNPLITIIFSCVFFGLVIILIILIRKNVFGGQILPFIILSFFIVIIIYFIAELSLMALHYSRFPQIHIKMDSRMEYVLDKYNLRTILCQLFRIIGLGFNLIAIVLFFVFSWVDLIGEIRRILI